MRSVLTLSVVALLSAIGCSSSTPVIAPTPPPVIIVAPPPPTPISAANFQYGDGSLVCERGFCFSFTMVLTNVGPGCAQNVNAIVSWFGADGAIPLPNTPSIQMGAPGGLTTYFFRPGQSLLLTSTTGFNDVRSVHTVYRANATWTNVRC
jgi:hypothetical protein